jgi:hypothetical protein
VGIGSSPVAAVLSGVCKTILWLYIVVSVLSVLIIPASDMRLFGLVPDPFAGVFAILLAQPWISLIFLIPIEASQTWNIIMIAACLALNAILIRLLCGWLRRRG